MISIIFLNCDQLGQTVLFSANVTRDAALSVATRAKSAIKSATRNAIGEREGIFIDGSLTIELFTMRIRNLEVYWLLRFIMGIEMTTKEK